MAIIISAVKIQFKGVVEPTTFITPFVARALMTNGNVNAAKLG